ncbi:hypothetical protein Tco_0385808 [Tanacetum coccineum]
MLSRMLSRRLEVDHECEMAFELLRFTRSQLKKIKRHMGAVEVTTANMEITTTGYVSTAGEHYRRYSKSLLLLERGGGEKVRVLSLELIFSLPSILSSLPRVPTNLDQRNLLGLKVFLVLLKLLLLVMIVTATGYVSAAGEVQRKYSKSLLLLVLVTSVKEYYYLWFWVMNKIIDKLLKNNSLNAKRAGNSRGNRLLKSILNKTSYTPADNVAGITIDAGVIHKGVDINGLNTSGASATDEDKQG